MNTLLQHLNQALQPNTLKVVGKAEAREIVLVMERMKVLLEQIEILRLSGDEDH